MALGQEARMNRAGSTDKACLHKDASHAYFTFSAVAQLAPPKDRLNKNTCASTGLVRPTSGCQEGSLLPFSGSRAPVSRLNPSSRSPTTGVWMPIPTPYIENSG